MTQTLETLRVLIVDDIEGERLLIRDMLQEIGFRNISEADDGATAIEMIGQGAFQLVVSDFRMPKVSGSDLLSFVRKHRDMCMTPFVMVTAQTDAIPLRSAIAPNRTAWLYKPLGFGVFKTTVLSLMKRWYQIEQAPVMN